jgi:hypothetical protein
MVQLPLSTKFSIPIFNFSMPSLSILLDGRWWNLGGKAGNQVIVRADKEGLDLGLPLVDLLFVIGLEEVEVPLTLGDGAVKAVPGCDTMDVDNGADIAPLDNPEALALFVHLAPLVDKSISPVAPRLAAPLAGRFAAEHGTQMVRWLLLWTVECSCGWGCSYKAAS